MSDHMEHDMDCARPDIDHEGYCVDQRNDGLTVGDLIDIDVLIEHQCRMLDDLEDTVFVNSNRGKRIVLMERRRELKLLQERVRNTRTERLAAGER